MSTPGETLAWIMLPENMHTSFQLTGGFSTLLRWTCRYGRHRQRKGEHFEQHGESHVGVGMLLALGAPCGCGSRKAVSIPWPQELPHTLVTNLPKMLLVFMCATMCAVLPPEWSDSSS